MVVSVFGGGRLYEGRIPGGHSTERRDIRYVLRQNDGISAMMALKLSKHVCGLYNSSILSHSVSNAKHKIKKRLYTLPESSGKHSSSQASTCP